MENFDHDTTYMRVGGDDAKLRPWHYICGGGTTARARRPPEMKEGCAPVRESTHWCPGPPDFWKAQRFADLPGTFGRAGTNHGRDGLVLGT